MTMANVYHLVNAAAGTTKWNFHLDTKKLDQPAKHLNFGEYAFLLLVL